MDAGRCTHLRCSVSRLVMVAAALMFEVASRYCALLTSATPNPPDVLFTLHYGKLHGIDLNSTSGGCIPSACKTPEEAFEAINRALDLVNAVVNKTLRVLSSTHLLEVGHAPEDNAKGGACAACVDPHIQLGTDGCIHFGRILVKMLQGGLDFQ